MKLRKEKIDAQDKKDSRGDQGFKARAMSAADRKIKF